jgi:hypothetical protein
LFGAASAPLGAPCVSESGCDVSLDTQAYLGCSQELARTSCVSLDGRHNRRQKS